MKRRNIIQKKTEDDIRGDIYNQGRQAGEQKWLEAINKKIEELEMTSGIKELKKLKEKTRYRWK